MRRFFAALGLAAASTFLAGCPVYSAESCVESSDCANGFVCDGGRNECVADAPSGPRCSVSSDCGANHYCRQDGVCTAIDDCRWSGCPGGYVCEATSSAAPRCVIGSSGKGGSSAAGSGGSSLGGSGGSGGSSLGGSGGSGGSGQAGAAGEPSSGGAAGDGSGGQAAAGSAGLGGAAGAAAGGPSAGAGGEAQAGASQGGSSQAGASQGGASQAGAGGAGSAGAPQGGSSQGGTSQGGTSQGGASQGGASQAGSGGSGQAGGADAGSGGSDSAGSGGAAAGSGGSSAGSGGSAGAPAAICDDGGLASASGSLQLVSQSTATACSGGLSSKPLEGKLAIAGGKGAPADSWTFEAIGVAASQPEIRCNEGGVVCSFTFQRTEGTSTTRYTSTAAPFTVKVTIWNDGSFIGTAEQVKTIRRVTVPGQTDQQVVEGVTLVMVATAN